MQDIVRSDPLRDLSASILRHPRFDQGLLIYVDEIFKWRRSLGRFAAATTSYVGTYVVGFVMFLHYSNTSGRADGGATFTRLLEYCKRRDLCGSRALRTIVTLASVAGYLKSQRGDDRRVQVFTPTEKLLSKSRDLYHCPMTFLDHLVERPIYAEMVRTDPSFIPRLMTTTGRQFVDDGILITDFFPQLHELMNLTGGCPIVLAMVASELSGKPCPSTRALGKDFRISASQVRHVLRRAQDHGLISLTTDGQVASAANLAALYRQMAARELALYAKCTLGLEPYFRSAASRVGQAISTSQ